MDESSTVFEFEKIWRRESEDISQRAWPRVRASRNRQKFSDSEDFPGPLRPGLHVVKREAGRPFTFRLE